MLATGPALAQVTPPPSYAQWEQNMVTFGTSLGEAMLALTPDQVANPDDYSTSHDSGVMGMRYYDGQYSFLRIAAHLESKGQDASRWYLYADRAGEIYHNHLLNRSTPYRAAGFDRFSHGFYTQWTRTGDPALVNVLVNLRDVPPFSVTQWDNTSSWYQQRYSREIAYSIQSQIMAERAGQPRQTSRLNTLVDMSLGHINIWTTGQYISTDPGQQYVSAFMTGLTATALIEYNEQSHDARVLPAVQSMADWLWQNMWVSDVNGSGHGAFYYRRMADGTFSGTPAPDLNLLIAPMYGWLFRETGDEIYLQRGDLIFQGGAELAWLGSGKHFNQQYRNSFDYLIWREQGLIPEPASAALLAFGCMALLLRRRRGA